MYLWIFLDFLFDPKDARKDPKNDLQIFPIFTVFMKFSSNFR